MSEVQMSAALEELARTWANEHADEVLAAVEADDYTGFCVSCGEEAGDVEPDATGYLCESCGERHVIGSQVLLFMTET